MIHRDENGRILSEQGAEQWLGTAAEFLADFGTAFDAVSPPTLAALAAACRKREARNAPPAPAPLTKAERIKLYFEDRPEMLALVDDIAVATGRTRLQVIASLTAKLVV